MVVKWPTVVPKKGQKVLVTEISGPKFGTIILESTEYEIRKQRKDFSSLRSKKHAKSANPNFSLTGIFYFNLFIFIVV